MSSQSGNQLVYGYWAIRGLAEPSRLALRYRNVPFEDKQYVQGEGPEYSRDDWLSAKFKLGLDFPNLPYFVDGDLKMTQSKAILYYIGRKFNLMGATPAEEGRAMMLCEEAHDFRLKLSGFCYGPNGASDEARQQFVDTVVKEDLKKFENYLANKKTNFSASDHVTVADFQLFDYLDAGFAMDQSNSVVKEFPHIQRFLTSIRELPELKDYIAKIQAEVPFNNKVAKFGGKVIPRSS